MEKTILVGPYNIELILDPSEINLDNPGDGCPALVRYKDGTASYTCACCEGEVDSGYVIQLPEECIDWLFEQEDKIEEMYAERTENT